MKKVLAILFGLLLLAPATGELWRIPLFGFDLLPSDFLIPLVFAVWLIYKIHSDRKVRLGRVGKAMLLFLFVLFATYLINFFRFDTHEMTMAGAYLCRFVMYIVIAFIAFDLLNRDEKYWLRILVGGMAASMVLISLLGFLQLRYFSSFLDLGMHLQGWDPHIGRLLSTWFDPNFAGGYLAFILGITIAMALYFRFHKNRRWFLAMSSISFVGLIAAYLTYSRSSYLALLTVLGILALFKSRKLIVVTFVVVILGFSLSGRVQERFMDAWGSARVLFGIDVQQTIDPTTQLRLWSWDFAREIISDHPFAGIGFNRYKYEINTRGHGLLTDHASGGSDSSLLTIWATTGVFGLLTYLAVGFVAAVCAFKRILKKTDFRSYLSSGLLAGFGGMMLHSVFVNSLLFPLIMVYLYAGIGLLDE
ncbi:O-antigen ligase family protein [Candidatus Peregrinibacteria bacterium]|nr:O-antigen ligase family protein [Candidatus Peregrinibacteria bacterium]